MEDDKVSRREFSDSHVGSAATAVAGVSGAGHVHARRRRERLPIRLQRAREGARLGAHEEELGQPGDDGRRRRVLRDAVGPHIGAKLVARSWVDAEFRARLLADARAVAREEQLVGLEGTDLVAVENTPTGAQPRRLHAVLVLSVAGARAAADLVQGLGLSRARRHRSARRSREFGLELADDVEVRVWDSPAEIRYLVIPERPSGTEGLSLDELARLVTRDSMVGAEKLRAPG